MSTGVLRYGDRAAREVSARFGGYFANDAALTALAADNRADNMVVMVGSTMRVFSATATAGGLAPDAGSGRWLETSAPTLKARLATAAVLPNNTRTGNVLLADAPGALGNIDGVLAVVGNKILVKDEVAGANDGLYVVTSVGGATAWSMVRAPEMDSSAETLSGTLVVVSEGTANADQTFVLTTNDPITLNTTALVFGDFEPDGSVVRADIAADAIDGTKLADDAVDSEHIADGAIDLAHMSANSVDSDQYVDGSIDLIHLSVNSVDSDQYVDGSIDPEHLATGAVTAPKLAADAVAPITVVRVATAAALPANTVTGAGLIMTANANGNINDTGVDGIVNLLVGEYLLIKDEADNSKHGVWQVTQLGVVATSPFIFTRVAPFDTSAKVKPSMLVGVSEGTANLNSLWKLDTNAAINLGVTNLVFTPAIERASIANDAINGAKIVDDAVDSEHIAAGAIDPEHFAALSVETAAINNGAVTAAKLANGAGVAALLAAGLGASVLAAHDTASPLATLAADAVNARAMIVVAVVTEAFTTTCAMSVQNSAGAPVVLLNLAALTAPGVYIGAGVIPADVAESAIVTAIVAGATGEASITVLALPTA